MANNPSKTRKKGHITIPYVGHVSDAISSNMRKAGVVVHMKLYNTLRTHLVHPKDKVAKEDQTGLVYHLKCRGDGEEIKETYSRTLPHFLYRPSSGHQMADVHILHQEPDWFRIGVAEAIHVMKEQPTLNRGRERHTLQASIGR